MNFPRIVTHCGSTKFGIAFEWANREDTLDGKIVQTIGCTTQPDSILFRDLEPEVITMLKEALDQLHLRKIDRTDEVFILNATGGYIGTSTLHELCYAYNQRKALRWMEPWIMQCFLCGCEGLEAHHFFHMALNLEEFERLAASLETPPYLVGQVVNWHGQMAPVVALEHGELALQVDLPCVSCGKRYETMYVVADEGSFSHLILKQETDKTVIDVCDADQRSHGLRCPDCIAHQQVFSRFHLCTLTIRSMDDSASDVMNIVPVSQLPELIRPLWPVIVSPDFERFSLRQGLREYIVRPYCPPQAALGVIAGKPMPSPLPVVQEKDQVFADVPLCQVAVTSAEVEQSYL